MEVLHGSECRDHSKRDQQNNSIEHGLEKGDAKMTIEQVLKQREEMIKRRINREPNLRDRVRLSELRLVQKLIKRITEATKYELH